MGSYTAPGGPGSVKSINQRIQSSSSSAQIESSSKAKPVSSEQLVNKIAGQLPPGVDPDKKEVGKGLRN